MSFGLFGLNLQSRYFHLDTTIFKTYKIAIQRAWRILLQDKRQPDPYKQDGLELALYGHIEAFPAHVTPSTQILAHLSISDLSNVWKLLAVSATF